MPADWEEPFLAAVARDDVDATARSLAPLRTAHAGTPPMAVKTRAVRLLTRRFDDQPDALLAAAVSLTEAVDDGANEICLLLIPRFFPDHPARVGLAVARFADHPNWEVRENAAAAVADLVVAAGRSAIPWLHQHAGDRSPNTRRAVVVGCGWAPRRVDVALARQLLEVLSPLTEDGDPYVGRNLGTFAIGDGFLRAHPEPTLAWLTALAASNHPRARWNVATALSAAAAADHLPALDPLLTVLVDDTDPAVRRAALAAARTLLRRRPETMDTLLETWRTDPQRAAAAERLRPIRIT